MKNADDIKLNLDRLDLGRDHFEELPLEPSRKVRRVFKQTGDTRTLSETVRDLCVPKSEQSS